MEILLLCTTGIIIAGYAEKRSCAVTIGHSILFVFLLLCSLFTTNVGFIQNAMTNVIGSFSYNLIREAILTPYIWFYSANAVITLFEFVLLLVIAITATVFVVRTILNSREPYVPRPSTDCKLNLFPVTDLAEGGRIFLRYCKLLD